MSTLDAPALNPDGTLKDASEIEWLNSLSDEHCSISLFDSYYKRPENPASSSTAGASDEGKKFDLTIKPA
jgi:hypothetical protein